MDKINPVVAARVATELAKAQERVARLEADMRTAPVNTGKGWTNVNVGKRLTEARSQAASWAYVLEHTDPLAASLTELPDSPPSGNGALS